MEKAGLEVIELPLADDIVHMNFYIGSGGEMIYVPICGDPRQDEPALEILRDLFTEVIPIKSTPSPKQVEEFTAIHSKFLQLSSTSTDVPKF